MLKIFLLGQQVITDDANGDVRPSSSKTLALLTLLVLTPTGRRPGSESPPPCGPTPPMLRP